MLQKCADTQRDILQATESDMRAQVDAIRAASAGAHVEVACHCETFGDFEKSKRYIEMAMDRLKR